MEKSFMEQGKEKLDPLSREAYENIPQEFDWQARGLYKAHKELEELLAKLADKEPTMLEKIRIVLKGFEVTSRSELKGINIENRREDFVNEAHAEALKIEERRRKLQDRVSHAVKELIEFEEKNLGGKLDKEKRMAA